MRLAASAAAVSAAAADDSVRLLGDVAAVAAS
jgi:hypothetical protein